MPHPAPLIPSQFYTLSDEGRLRYEVFEPSTDSSELPRGTLLIAPGRREFIEKKYAELGSELLQRHFRLVFFEWRGQGLSSRFLDGAKRQRDHLQDFNTHLADLDSFYKDIVRPRQAGPLLVFGHSMGGHLLLRWLAERQKTGVQAAIVTAPMLALGPRMMHVMTHGLARLEVGFGRGDHYAPGQHNYGSEDQDFATNPLTHDPKRFAIIQNYFDAHPEMTVGGVTWAWLNAALKSMHETRSQTYLKQLQLPILSIMGDVDRVTPTAEVSRYIAAIPNAESIVIPNAMHDIMNETDMLRAMAWTHIDRFLSRVRAS